MRNAAALLAVVCISSIASADGSSPVLSAGVAANDDASRDDATLQRLILMASEDVAPLAASLKRRERRRRIAGAVLLGLGTPALAGATMIGASFAVGFQNALGSLNCDAQHSCPTVQANRSTIIAGGAFAAAGLATTISGAVLMSLARDDRAQVKRLTLSAAPVVGPGYAGVAVAGLF